MTLIIAHRGLRNERPENSRESLESAIALPGIHGVEFDVEVTRDGRCMVLHQETVVPSADLKRIELARRDFLSRDWVGESLAADIAKMDAGSWMGTEFAGVIVASLEDVLGIPWGSVIPYVELKDPTFWSKRDPLRPRRVAEAALPYIANFNSAINVISFNPEILREVRSGSPDVATTLALWTEWRWRSGEAVEQARNCGASTISLPDTMLLEDAAWLRVAHDNGLQVHAYPITPARGEPEFACWTAESQTNRWRQLEHLGVDAILSDFARETLEVLAGD